MKKLSKRDVYNLSWMLFGSATCFNGLGASIITSVGLGLIVCAGVHWWREHPSSKRNTSSGE
ncbi:hypothetical protein L4D76_13060 [Photobacterium sagamiensis]|uniref:hypothetical protein n=1 Tax=Photobacterium sagamiensis TaxID=2910241 RepID=UPI003D14AB8A